MMQSSQDLRRKHTASLAPLGYGLGAVSLLAVIALLHHPVGRGQQPADILASIRSQAATDKIVHATLALVFGFLNAAMAVFAVRLDVRRFTVVAGLVAFSGAFVLTMLAAITDGFVLPAIAAHCAADLSTACASEAVSLLRLSAIQIEYMTRFSFVSVTAAVAAWSIALLTTRDMPAWAGLVGLTSAGCQMAALLAASGPLAPASLLFVFAAQVVWYLLTASLMILQRGPFAATAY